MSTATVIPANFAADVATRVEHYLAKMGIEATHKAYWATTQGRPAAHITTTDGREATVSAVFAQGIWLTIGGEVMELDMKTAVPFIARHITSQDVK